MSEDTVTGLEITIDEERVVWAHRKGDCTLFVFTNKGKEHRIILSDEAVQAATKLWAELRANPRVQDR